MMRAFWLWAWPLSWAWAATLLVARRLGWATFEVPGGRVLAGGTLVRVFVAVPGAGPWWWRRWRARWDGHAWGGNYVLVDWLDETAGTGWPAETIAHEASHVRDRERFGPLHDVVYWWLLFQTGGRFGWSKAYLLHPFELRAIGAARDAGGAE